MTRALGTYRKGLVAAPAYLAAKGVPLIPDDLKAHACLHHKFPTSRKLERWPLRPEHVGIETELPKTAVASTLEPLICMAEQGVGIACLPDFAIAQQLREGVLVAVLDDYTDSSGTLRVLWPSSRHLSLKLRVFVDFLAANLFPDSPARRRRDFGAASPAVQCQPEHDFALGRRQLEPVEIERTALCLDQAIRRRPGEIV
jgi:DNA-binding transcriptional LysR family regulator